MTIANNQPQTIIRKKAGFEVPKEFLETALRKCPTVSGFSVRDVTDGVTTLEVNRADHAITVDNLVALNSAAKDYEVIIHLTNMTGKWAVDDIQPFTLGVREKEGDVPQVVVSFSVEGDFLKYSVLVLGHNDASNFV